MVPSTSSWAWLGELGCGEDDQPDNRTRCPHKRPGSADSDGLRRDRDRGVASEFGDESQGYKLVGHQAPDSASPSDSSDADITLPAAVVRDGRLLELYLYGPASAGDAALFEAAVKAGVAPGAHASLASMRM